MMEHDLNLLTNWFCANKLPLNLDKTVAIKFWNYKTNFQLHVNNFKIPIVSNIKFLGVHLDNQITWTVHINVLLEKIHLNRQMLSLGKNLLDRNSLWSVYFGHILTLKLWINSMRQYAICISTVRPLESAR